MPVPMCTKMPLGGTEASHWQAEAGPTTAAGPALQWQVGRPGSRYARIRLVVRRGGDDGRYPPGLRLRRR